MAKAHTILFEDKYGVNINDFSTTIEVDKVVSDKKGRNIEIALIRPDIISPRGDVFPKIDIDIDNKLDKTLKNWSGFLNPDNLFVFYRDEFLPAYSDFVGYEAKKPIQVLNELENTLAHLAQYYNPVLEPDQKKRNVEKSYDHLVRVTLDLYKLLWVLIHEELESVYLDENKRNFAPNIPEQDFIIGFNNFREKAQEARSTEINSIGANPLSALELYKDAIILGKELITAIDDNKLQKLKKFNVNNFIKQHLIGFCIGFLAGFCANYCWAFFSK